MITVGKRCSNHNTGKIIFLGANVLFQLRTGIALGASWFFMGSREIEISCKRDRKRKKWGYKDGSNG